MKAWRNQLALVSAALVLWCTSSAGASWQGLVVDPVVSEIVRMLETGISDDLILQWLESTRRRPGDVDSEAMIALAGAGASETLIVALLETLKTDNPAPGAGESFQGAEQEADDATGPQLADASAGGGASEGIEAVVRLRSKRIWTEEEQPDAPRQQPWGVYLYLDGEFVAWTLPTLQGEPVVARRILQPGHHEMRVVLQRYEERGEGWLYESRAVPSTIAFEMQPGGSLEIDIEMTPVWGLWHRKDDGGPLRYAVRQRGELLVENRGVGGNPDRWRPICEDVEANFPHRDSIPRAFRDAMRQCVGWESLWEGEGRASSRSEILAHLAADDFRPTVR